MSAVAVEKRLRGFITRKAGKGAKGCMTDEV
jgi:hypothetical protein